ncbi:hypothetical protein BH10ACT2_BH10ACT2_06820 [soil metagenome]
MKIESTKPIADGADGSRMGRRAALSAGVGVAAVSLLPLLTNKTAASSSTDSSSTDAPTTAAPTTTAPPRRPTNDDIALLGAAQQIELTARALYDVAIDAGAWSDTELTVVATIREAHEASAQALAGMLGGDAPGEMSQSLYASLVSGFRGSISARLEAAYNLESAAVATHHELLGQLIGTDGATLIAAVQSAEARHGTVLADLNGQTVVSTLLVEDEAAALEVNP